MDRLQDIFTKDQEEDGKKNKKSRSVQMGKAKSVTGGGGVCAGVDPLGAAQADRLTQSGLAAARGNIRIYAVWKPNYSEWRRRD